MATSAVVWAIPPGGGSAGWSFGTGEDDTWTSGEPQRPILSKGLSKALQAYPSQTLADRSILYWSPYQGSLRSCVRIGATVGYEIAEFCFFQDFVIVYLSQDPTEPPMTTVPKTSSGRGLETLAKNMSQTILNHARQNLSEFVNPFGEGYNKLQTFLSDPSEFVKSSPAMQIAKALDDFFRGSGKADGGTDSKITEVWCLPNETVGSSNVYGNNPIFGQSEGGGGGGGGGNDTTEKKDETLKRLLDNLSKLVTKFISSDDSERGPGSDIWDKIIGILHPMRAMGDLLSKITGTILTVPETIANVADMLSFITGFLVPLLSALGLSLGDDDSGENEPDQVDSNIDFTQLIEALTGDERSLYQLEFEFQEWLKLPENRIFIMGLLSQTNEVFDPEQ